MEGLGYDREVKFKIKKSMVDRFFKFILYYKIYINKREINARF